MKELPRLEVNHDEDVVAAEPEVAEFNEVAGPEGSCLLTKEGGPTLTVWRRAADLAQVPLDGSLGDGDAELEEFTADALGAPEAVLGHAACAGGATPRAAGSRFDASEEGCPA